MKHKSIVPAWHRGPADETIDSMSARWRQGNPFVFQSIRLRLVAFSSAIVLAALAGLGFVLVELVGKDTRQAVNESITDTARTQAELIGR